MTLIDSHCHLDSEDFNADREAVIDRALAAGVEKMVAIGTGDGPPDLEVAVRLADTHGCILATVGVHPHEASKATHETYPRLRELLNHPKVIALGEIGLDYHYDHSPRDVQRTVFIAAALNEVSIDALALELGSNRNAIYKNLFDARRKLRCCLADAGHPLTEQGATA